MIDYIVNFNPMLQNVLFTKFFLFILIILYCIYMMYVIWVSVSRYYINQACIFSQQMFPQ